MVIRITIHYGASVKVTVTWRQRHTPIGRMYVTDAYITVSFATSAVLATVCALLIAILVRYVVPNRPTLQ